MRPDVTLYFCKYSRAFVPRWLLEELAIPYRVSSVRIHRGEHKAPGYRRLNPMGKVPALTDGQAVVSENPRSACCSPTVTAMARSRRGSRRPRAAPI